MLYLSKVMQEEYVGWSYFEKKRGDLGWSGSTHAITVVGELRSWKRFARDVAKSRLDAGVKRKSGAGDLSMSSTIAKLPRYLSTFPAVTFIMSF